MNAQFVHVCFSEIIWYKPYNPAVLKFTYSFSCPQYTIFLHKCYRKTSNISRTLTGNEIVDNSDVVGASLVGAAVTTSSFST